MTTQITVRVSKTIQEQQYEPLTVDLTIVETCSKKKYNERLAELSGLLKEEAFAALGIGEQVDESELGEADISGESEGEKEGGFLPEEGEEGFEESFEGNEEGGFEEGGFEEGGEEGGFEEGGEEGGFEEGGEEGGSEGNEGEYQDDEFGDLFDDDQGETQ